MNDPLTLPGWQEFNHVQWNAKPVTYEFAPRGTGGPKLSLAAYQNSRGRFVLPPMNPHWPLVFTPTKTDTPSRLARQWSESAELLVEKMLECGTSGRIAFPGEIVDPRPWVWAGFHLFPLFTYYIDFPYDIAAADPSIRQKVRKSEKAGFCARRADDVSDMLDCFRETEQRQGFDHELTRESLQAGLDLMGPDAFRLYVCYAPDGEPASARLVIHEPGGRACDLAAGTKGKFLSLGVTQHLVGHMLNDLQTAGASGFNFCCANIESVAPSKANWGGYLVPLYGIEGFDAVPLRRLAGSFVRLLKNKRALRKRKQAAPQQSEAAPAPERVAEIPLAACNEVAVCNI
jgi:hypothetical protein